MVSDPMRPAADIDAEASAWLARLQGPHRSAASDAALKGWLKADPAHEAAFERATEIWEMIPGTGLRAEPAPVPAPRRSVLAAMILLLLTVGIGSSYALLGRGPVHETRIGEQKMARLDDGSRISLNTDSRVSVLYSDAERRVRLDRGEALFEVARDAARPFIVEAGNEQVRAIGTRFIVRLDPGGRTAVTLLEGRVEVSRTADSRPVQIATLVPGQRITVTATAGAALDRPSIDSVIAWQRGEVVFEDMSLIEAAEELNRYSEARILIADPALASLRISGVFSTGDPHEVAQAIAALHHLRTERRGDDIRLTR